MEVDTLAWGPWVQRSTPAGHLFIEEVLDFCYLPYAPTDPDTETWLDCACAYLWNSRHTPCTLSMVRLRGVGPWVRPPLSFSYIELSTFF